MTNKGSDIDMPTLEFAFEIRAEVLPPMQVGRTPDGTRVHIPITGGTFEGPNIKGTVLPGADRLVAPEGPHDWLNKSIFIGTVDANVADGYVLIRVDCVV